MNPPDFFPRSAELRVVHSFQELAAAPFAAGVNAVCWPRLLPGDFGEVVDRLQTGGGITTIDEARLRSLPVSPAGRSAVRCLLEDLRLLREHGARPELNCLREYPRDDTEGPVRTDVYSFHADSAPAEAETWLCTYHGAPSEGLANDQAQRRVDVPEIRAQLLADYGGEDDAGFAEYLEENCYDLHYTPLAGAQPFSFGVGNLWRIAVAHPGSAVPPCIHRAPETGPGTPPRLLLIS